MDKCCEGSDDVEEERSGCLGRGSVARDGVEEREDQG